MKLIFSIYDILIYYCLLTVIYCDVYAQDSLFIDWINTYYGPNMGNVRATRTESIANDKNNNVYIAGYATIAWDPNTIHDHPFVLKYDSLGNLCWIDFDSSSVGRAKKISIDKANNIYIIESIFSGIRTMKYNSTGIIEWIRFYDNPVDNFEEGVDVDIYNSRIIYSVGRTRNSEEGINTVIIKYDAYGNEKWIRIFNTIDNKNDVPTDIECDNEGNIYITGYTFDYPDYNFLTIKYDSVGNLLWSKEYNGPGTGTEDDFAYSLNVDKNGNAYVVGKSLGEISSYDYATLKYKKNGDLEWVRRYNGPKNMWDTATDLIVDDSLNVYVTGYSVGLGVTNYNEDVATIKYDSIGNIKWILRTSRNSNTWDRSREIVADKCGYFYVTAESKEYTVGAFNKIFTFKFSSNGILLSSHSFNKPNSDLKSAVGLSVDKYKNIVITGNDQDYCFTLKYIQRDPTTIPILNKSLNRSELVSNYPNPFNSMTKINYCVFKSGIVKILVYDITGKLVGNLVNDNKMPGEYEVDYFPNNLSSGVYIYKLVLDNKYQDSKKMLLLN